MINSLERAHLMMRYLYQHPRASTDEISQGIGIPSSSLRKTVSRDYPKSFIKHRLGGWALPDPIIWPEDIEFDISPPISEDEVTAITAHPVETSHPTDQWYRDKIDELTQALIKAGRETKAPAQPVARDKFTVSKSTRTEHDESIQELKKFFPQFLPIMQDAINRKKAAPNDKKEGEGYWLIYNMFKAALVTMSCQVSPHPSDKLKEYTV